MASRERVLTYSAVLAMVFLASQVAVPAFAAGYAITVKTDASAYSANQSITISGTVSPAPGSNTGVVITITNSAKAIADVAEVYADPSSGAYSFTSASGGNSAWSPGIFTVNATWGGSGNTATATTTFAYETTASSSSTSTTSTTTITSSTSKSTSSTVPEFPAWTLAILALAALAAVAAVSRRTGPRLPSMNR